MDIKFRHHLFFLNENPVLLVLAGRLKLVGEEKTGKSGPRARMEVAASREFKANRDGVRGLKNGDGGDVGNFTAIEESRLVRRGGEGRHRLRKKRRTVEPPRPPVIDTEPPDTALLVDVLLDPHPAS